MNFKPNPHAVPERYHVHENVADVHSASVCGYHRCRGVTTIWHYASVRRQDVSNGKQKPPPRTESYQSSLWFDDSSASDKSFSTMLTGDKSASRPASERSQNNLITETVAERRRRRRRRRGKTKRWEVEKGAGERKKACGDTGRMRRWERKKTGRQRRDHWVRGESRVKQTEQQDRKMSGGSQRKRWRLLMRPYPAQ